MRRKTSKDYYWSRVRRGLCQWCLEPAMPGMRLCQKHNKLNNQKRLKFHKERYWNNVSLGLCGWCSNPALPGIRVCEKHQKYNALKRKEYRLRCVANRKCVHCGKAKELTATTNYCNSCRNKYSEKRRREGLN